MKNEEGYKMQNNVIYAYRKKSNQKIVYVGQSVNIEQRHKQHIKYDPYNKNTQEYNYPLSRGVRKYGENEYELIILEDGLRKEQLNEREKYWIAFYDTYYNGYNQSTGGSYPTQPVFTEDKIDLIINMLKDESYSYKDIVEKTGVSMTHIYNINTGNRRKRDGVNYPIRSSNTKGTKGLKFSLEECLEIHKLLQTTELTYEEIAKKYNCSKDTISDINKGKTQNYRLDKYTYPIRSDYLVRKIAIKYSWKKRKNN